MADQIIPGVAIDVRAEALTTVIPGATGICGVVGTADWGPIDEPVTVDSFAEVLSTFGDDSEDTTMSRALNLIYANGANVTRCVRIAGASKNKATGNLLSTATPVITFEALYYGSLGNDIKVSYDDTRMLVTIRNAKLGVEEIHSASDGSATPSYNANTLVNNINNNSVLVVAAKAEETEPDATVNRSLTGGDSGTSVTSTDYDNGLTVLETVQCNLVHLAGQSSASDVANLKAHTDKMEANDEERIGFIGNEQGASVSTIKSNMNGVNSDRIVYCGPGVKFVPRYSESGAVEEFGGCYTAAAVMGKVSSLLVHISPTNKVLSGISDTEYFLNKGDVQDLILSRVCAIRNVEGIRIQKGITSSTDSAWHQITTRRIVDAAKLGIRSAGLPFVGKLNNERTRTALKGTIDAFLDGMFADESITYYNTEVYATRANEIAGVCRVDLTIRPVFSIDFIKVTLFLE